MKRISIILIVVGCSLLAICAVILSLGSSQENLYKPDTDTPVTTVPQNIPEYVEGVTAITQEIPVVSDLEVIEYVSKYNFEALKQENPDIIGWFEMEGLGLSEPLMFKEDDNSYYLHRNSKGEDSKSGSLFIENYNTPDFSDRVTIIYGHNMRSGAMFGDLQHYYKNEEFFAENNTFKIYTPDAEFVCDIFAAFPYSNKHILYYNDFSSFKNLEKFIKNCFSIRNLIAIFEKDVIIEENDKIVILSTCLDGDSNGRYLVMAKITQSEDLE